MTGATSLCQVTYLTCNTDYLLDAQYKPSLGWVQTSDQNKTLLVIDRSEALHEFARHSPFNTDSYFLAIFHTLHDSYSVQMQCANAVCKCSNQL